MTSWLVQGAVRPRREYQRFGVARYVLTNENDDHAAAGRKDYSVEMSGSTPPAAGFVNVEQTATCDEGYTGDPVVVAAGEYGGASQAAANAAALAAAEAGLVCVEIGPQIVGVTFVSRTGSGSLRGWSKYQNHNSGDWNTRKMTRVVWSGDLDDWEWYRATVSQAACLAAAWEEVGTKQVYVTDAVWDVATDTRQQGFVVGWIGQPCGNITQTEYSPAGGYANPEGQFVYGGVSTSYPTDWSKQSSGVGVAASTCSIGGCSTVNCLNSDNCSGTGQAWYNQPAIPALTTLFTATEFDTVAAAQARGTPTVGSSAETLPGTIGSTGAVSATAISLGSGTRSVVASIECSNLTAMADYEITATLTRRDASDDSFISEEEVVIVFTAGDVTDTVDYSVPIETGVKVEFTSADSIAAA